jgi:nucleoid-associated protein YgaU
VTLYTQKEVQAEATKVGFTPSEAEIMAAICMAESVTYVNGYQYADSSKVGDQNLADEEWGYSYGAPQVRSRNDATGTGSFYDKLKLQHNLSFQLRAAFALFKTPKKGTPTGTRHFSPWTTYNNGTYKGYMQNAVLNPKPAVPDNVHFILGGQSLSAIAALPKYKQRFKWQDLALVNGLRSPYIIYPGKTLLLPVWEYTVAQGDSLSKIASAVTHLEWEELAEFNEMQDPNKLFIGQIILIPHPAFLERLV